MSITDELMEWAHGFNGPWKRNEEMLLAIADRIDAEHERLMRERRRSCVFYDVERNHCKVHDEVDIAELGWVRLPKDADGEPINIGDVMENIVCPSVHREVMGVGVECFYGWDDGNGRYSQFDVACYRHHHAPTVEDVLFEFARFWSDEELTDIEHLQPHAAQTIAEYAAKLRLAEGSE